MLQLKTEQHCDCTDHNEGKCSGELYLMLPDRHDYYRCARHIRLIDAWMKAKFEQAVDGRYTAPRKGYDHRQTFRDWYANLSETDLQKAEMIGEINSSEWKEIL